MSKTMVYIGPSVEGIVMTGTAFTGGYPPRVQGLLNKEPYMTDLFVSAAALAESRKTLRDPESRLNLLYRKAEKGGR